MHNPSKSGFGNGFTWLEYGDGGDVCGTGLMLGELKIGSFKNVFGLHFCFVTFTDSLIDRSILFAVACPFGVEEGNMHLLGMDASIRVV